MLACAIREDAVVSRLVGQIQEWASDLRERSDIRRRQICTYY